MSGLGRGGGDGSGRDYRFGAGEASAQGKFMKYSCPMFVSKRKWCFKLTEQW